MTQKNHHTARNTRQTTRTALIFSLLTLLVVSIGCKKDTKIIEPTPVDANALAGTMWIAPAPGYEHLYIKDTIVFLNNGMCKESAYGNTMDKVVDTFMKIYNVYTYNNGNGAINYFSILFRGIAPNRIYLGHDPKPEPWSTFTIENNKLTTVSAVSVTSTNIEETLNIYIKRENFNLY